MPIIALVEELSVVGFAKAAAMVPIVSIDVSPFSVNTLGMGPNTEIPVNNTRRQYYEACPTTLCPDLTIPQVG